MGLEGVEGGGLSDAEVDEEEVDEVSVGKAAPVKTQVQSTRKSMKTQKLQKQVEEENGVGER